MGAVSGMPEPRKFYRNNPRRAGVSHALSIKLAQVGVSTPQICGSLGVSPQYVSKWKHRFQQEGVGCLRVAYRVSQSFLTDAQREVVLAWIGQHESLGLEELCRYLDVNYGITYQSKQSYYDL